MTASRLSPQIAHAIDNHFANNTPNADPLGFYMRLSKLTMTFLAKAGYDEQLKKDMDAYISSKTAAIKKEEDQKRDSDLLKSLEADPIANKIPSVTDEPTSTVSFFWKGDVKKGKSKLGRLELNFGIDTRAVYHIVPPEQNTTEYTPVKVEIERTHRELVKEKGAYKILPQYEKVASLSLKIDQLSKLHLMVNLLTEYENHSRRTQGYDGIWRPEIRYKREEYAEQISKPTLENGVAYDLFINSSADLELEAQLKVHEKTTTSQTQPQAQVSLPAPTPTTTTAPQPTKKDECIIA